MSAAQLLNTLEIVGYATVLTEQMRPTVVPPVFRLESDPERHFVPPYTLNGDALNEAQEITPAEAESLARADEITLFRQRIPAQPKHELWVDEEGKVHYEPQETADEHLLALAKQYVERAAHALATGRLEEASKYCAHAVAADDRLVDPFAIEAAICKLQNDATGYRLARDLAAGISLTGSFEQLVKMYLDRGRKRNVSHVSTENFSRPMLRIATHRPLTAA